MQKIAFCGWSAPRGNDHISPCARRSMGDTIKELIGHHGISLLASASGLTVRRCRNRKSIMLAMKLTIILLTAVFLNVHASGVSQNISFSGKNVTLKKVFAEVKKQTGYTFFGNTDAMNLAPLISVRANNMPLQQFLREVFRDLPLEYTIENRNIVISRKAESYADKTTDVNTARLREFIPPVTINGVVTDPNGNPLAGATVALKNSKSAATSTDPAGRFSLKASEGDVLVISYIGFSPKEMKLTDSMIAAAGQLMITLERNIAGLDTAAVVINTGFQLIKKEKMTGATVSVGSAELEKRYTPNILDNLEGRTPGLVTYRGVTSIRGVSTINASKMPLLVLDGLPVEGSVADVNPYDVENITILKDAAAAAIYGARAANGVIVITTKKAKGKRTSVSFSSDVTLSQKPDIDFNLATPAQQVDLESSVYKYVFANTGGLYPNTAAAVTATATSISNGAAIPPVYYAYYQLAKGEITQNQLDERLAALKRNNFRQQFKDNALLNGLLQQYNVAVRADGDKFQSSLVLNYKTDNAGIINAHNRQLNIFYKGSYQVSKWLEAGYGVNTVLGYIKSSNSNFATLATNVSPYQPLLDENGKRVYYTTADYNVYNTNTATQPVNSLLVNHLDELDKDVKNTRQQNSRYYVNLTAKLLEGLTLTPQFQYESTVSTTTAYSEADSYIMRYLKSIYTNLLPASGGKLATTNSRGDYWTARVQGQYQRSFGIHAVDLLAGTEFRQTRIKGISNLLLGYDDQLQSQSTTSVNFPALNDYKTTTAFKPGFNTTGLYTTYISNAIGVIPETVHRFNSNYANATYTYDNRYNVFGSYRVDYADVFGLDEKFRGKPLWSAGIGWNAHNEAFLAAAEWINFLKLRATYGITGNIVQGVSSFLTANSTLFNPVTNLPLSVVTNAANPELRWEKTATINLGIDFNLFNSRLNGSLDWYRKKGSDLLVTQRLDPSEGFTSQIINNGGLLNNGVELQLQYEWFRPVKKDGLSWSSAIVMSYNKNRITYIDEVATTPLALAQGGYKVGYPVNALFSYQYKGLNNNGQPQWLKSDGSLSTIALTANDLGTMVYSGSTDPKVNVAFTNEWHYKGFSLYVLAVYYGGQYLRALVPEVVSGVPYGAMPAYLADSWMPGKTNTIVPGFGQFAPGVYPGTQGSPPFQLGYSDRFVRAGDFIKLRSMVLGYELPQQVAAKIASRGIRLHFQLNNAKALWTRNGVGIDPETGGARMPASYVFGISVNY